ncbi:5'-nucleotidase [Candidatus Vesicomyidisocius calyptogenae]|uniref:5'-nucleotidase n=1 Tax=Vesicomyosocius okutanii subsp. Calyptogena okutanii (strain HA) TaxID=412965 RepID=A5CWE5_VESOH|nr:5'-nucleotidase [Candidatus Vesicomyosocius okutanii]BAF61728.1 5'-nucleotidase [Candidatus Vesicomyosocius okutanii]
MKNTVKKNQEKNKLVITISSRALFNLDESHKIFKEQGVKAYTQHQEENEKVILKPGVGFSLVKKLLALNTSQNPIDVILLSRNSADTSLRIFNSIENYGLNISKAAFTRGESTHNLVGAFGADLFLSSNYLDVQKALESGFAAASIVGSSSQKQHKTQLRIAFDGDAVIFSDESERIFQEKGLKAFIENEKNSANIALKAGPFKCFVMSLQRIQSSFPTINNPIRTALITARSAPSHKRVIHTMRKWGIRIDESFFLGGLEKGIFLKEFSADIFFDDQHQHCQSASKYVPTGHVPNRISSQKIMLDK